MLAISGAWRHLLCAGRAQPGQGGRGADRLTFGEMASIWAALPADIHRRLRLVQRQRDEYRGSVFGHGCQAFLPWADRVAAIALPEGMRRKTLSGCSAATGEHARPSPNPWHCDPLLNNRGAYALTARVHIPDPVPVGIPVFRVTHLQSTLYCLAWRQAQRSLCGGRNWPS